MFHLSYKVERNSMLALGLQGSPNKQGSTVYLLNRFMAEMADRGIRTHTIDVAEKNIRPCKGCGYCEKKGFCVIRDDDMAQEIYALLRQAEIIVTASPVFFYSVTSQLKALIDRSQALWSRKYRFQLSDPLKRTRKGFLLSLGGSRGKQLFDGVTLVAKYFFDAVDAGFSGSLTYRNIETQKDISQHASVNSDIASAVENLLSPMLGRKKVVFAGKGNACRSQMAAAFARHLAGDTLDVMTGGTTPLARIDQNMVQVMAEMGLDLAFHSPQPLKQVMMDHVPDNLVSMDEDPAYDTFPESNRMAWNLPDADGMHIDQVRILRDEIENKVKSLLKSEELLHHESLKT